MIQLRVSKMVSLLLLIALFCQSMAPLAFGQGVQRNRQVTNPTPKAIPSASPTPTPTPTPELLVTPSPAPTATPTPTPAPRTATTTRTLQALQTSISEVLRRPELDAAFVGIKVVSLDSGKILFEDNARKLLRPASNMKLYTVAAAMDRLTPDYRFQTSVYAPSRPNSDGVLRGDLTIYGRGDPSIAARFNNGDYFKAIDELATRIVAAGVKRVEGDLVGDETYFVGPKYGAGWEWEDLTWYYGAEVTPLAVNDNALDLFVKPGTAVGQPAVITTGPPDPLLTIVNKVTTSAKGVRRQLNIHRGLGENTVTIAGSIPLEDPGYTGAVSISHPGLLFIYLLRNALAQQGVAVTGKSRTTGIMAQPPLLPGPNPSAPITVEIAKVESPPFGTIAAQTMKPSQNLYTELILRTL